MVGISTMSVRHRRLLTLLSIVALCLGLVLAFGGCSSHDDATTSHPTPLFSVTGKVVVKSDLAVPDGARLYCGWMVSSESPDYTYVYGTGTVDMTTKTFRIDFTAAPPDEALNRVGTTRSRGVGILAFMLYPGPTEGRMPSEGLPSTAALYGAVNNAAVIYVRHRDSALAARPDDWIRRFQEGFSIGIGVDEAVGFDSFEPAGDRPLELYISDDQDDFVFPNWT